MLEALRTSMDLGYEPPHHIWFGAFAWIFPGEAAARRAWVSRHVRERLMAETSELQPSCT
jgi:hypothetical protein